MRLRTTRSIQPCPVCGNREWHPLSEAADYGGNILGTLALGRWEKVTAVIDIVGYDGAYDECSRCGTVVA